MKMSESLHLVGEQRHIGYLTCRRFDQAYDDAFCAMEGMDEIHMGWRTLGQLQSIMGGYGPIYHHEGPLYFRDKLIVAHDLFERDVIQFVSVSLAREFRVTISSGED